MELTGVNVIFCGRDELSINYLETYFTIGGYAVNKIHSYYSPFDKSIISNKGIGIVYISSNFLESSKCMQHSAFLTQRIKDGEILPVITACTNLDNVQGYIEHWNHTNCELTESGISFLNFLQESNYFYYTDGPTDGEKLVLKVNELKSTNKASRNTIEEVTSSLEVSSKATILDSAQRESDTGVEVPNEATMDMSEQQVSTEVPNEATMDMSEQQVSTEVSNEAMMDMSEQQVSMEVLSEASMEKVVKEEESYIEKLERILIAEAENDARSVEYYEKVLDELNDKLNEIKVENRVAALDREIKKVKDIQTIFLTTINEAKKKTEEQQSIAELSKVYENQVKETKRFYTIKIEKLLNLISQKDLELERMRLVLQQEQKKNANTIAEKITGQQENIQLEENISEETSINADEEKQRKIRRATIKNLIKEQEVANKPTEEQVDRKGSNKMAMEQSVKVANIDQNTLLQKKIFDLFSEYERELQKKYKTRVEGIDTNSNSTKDREDFDKRIDPLGNNGMIK